MVAVGMGSAADDGSPPSAGRARRGFRERISTPAGEPPAELALPGPVDPLLASIHAVLVNDPRHVDDIAGEAGISPAQAVAGLLELEVTGHARQAPGLRFARPAGKSAKSRNRATDMG
jgi:predicted Rossmann fold nucleotide-binding protein DprA/Smf involved in DNA uptake